MSAKFNYPSGVAFDGAGNLYIADNSNHRVRKMDTAGVVTTVAGNGIQGYSGDNGPATLAQLNHPTGVALDVAGNLFIVEPMSQRVRKVSPSGIITTVAGDGGQGFSGDGGPATSAQFYNPFAIAIDGAGNLYIADSNNQRVRKVDPTGTIATVAGNGVEGYSGDNGPAVAAEINTPNGVAVDGAGNLYISDLSFHVRKVDPAGTITTVAGNGTASYSGDNGPATLAGLGYPDYVVHDGMGNLYIGDSSYVRKVDPAGIIITVAGGGSVLGDGGPATQAMLNIPQGATVDGAGDLYIADSYDNRVRKVYCPVSNTATPTHTSTVTATTTFTLTPTATPTFTDSATASPTPSSTHFVSFTPTPTDSPTSTGTFFTPTPTNTHTSTDTPGPPTDTPTATETPGIPTDTFTPTATPSATSSFTPTPSFTAPFAPTNTPTAVPFTPTPTPTSAFFGNNLKGGANSLSSSIEPVKTPHPSGPGAHSIRGR